MNKLLYTLVAGSAACALSLGLMGCGTTTTTTTTAGSDTAAEETQEQEQKTTELAAGTTVNFASGLSVTVDSVETGLANYDGSTCTGIHVTYVNNGDEGADYNIFDWKGQDANGAQQASGYYSEGSDELQSGTLTAGGTVSGNIYFEGDVVLALYYENIFMDDTPSASWTIQ